MCFEKKLGEKDIREIESPHLFILSIFTSFNEFSVIPTVTKILFRKRWEEIVSARRKQAEIFLLMIRERHDRK
ncbi:hypothetical protein KSP39_PZI016392 [Platanthera zijinensis]|uniref:Uncharacterized protein n=1 Tax=Platanthera zijinensis TaxID=2320716 RepID=A0AAP0B6T3_9ASPA